MNEQIITVKQIPVIEESLSALAAGIDERVALAMSMVVTEDTVPAVKTVRADLNKEFALLEDMRKQVKAQVMAPYQGLIVFVRQQAIRPTGYASGNLRHDGRFQAAAGGGRKCAP